MSKQSNTDLKRLANYNKLQSIKDAINKVKDSTLNGLLNDSIDSAMVNGYDTIKENNLNDLDLEEYILLSIPNTDSYCLCQDVRNWFYNNFKI